MKKIIFLLFFSFCFAAFSQNKKFGSFCSEFLKELGELSVSEIGLDYKINFSNIKNKEALLKEKYFFDNYSKKIKLWDPGKLSSQEKIRYKQLIYETSLNLERIALELKWNEEGRKIPDGGLHALSNYKEWYSYYVKFFTSVNITPEAVFELGSSEVKLVQNEILKIRNKLGLSEEAFYQELKADSFFYTSKPEILKAYAEIDKTVRSHFEKLFPKTELPEIGVMEWPNASATTPPGIYLNRSNNAYGKDVFEFNFYNSKHNKRCMNWLYMHEAIPGHHLQFTTKSLQPDSPMKNQFFYFGNAEGWACYVEDLGKEVGLYQNDFSYLGKWEWDLVRSARLVMEVGIHYYGWSFEKAMAYWKENIKGQDEIAEREINRITNWAGQALCYKVGASAIKKMVKQKLNGSFDLKTAHQFVLQNSDVPLQVLLEEI